jgi:hypothetical protein
MMKKKKRQEGKEEEEEEEEEEEQAILNKIEEEEEVVPYPFPRRSTLSLVPRISSAGPLPALHPPYTLLTAEKEGFRDNDDYFVGVMEELVDPQEGWSYGSRPRSLSSGTTTKMMHLGELIALTLCFLGIQFAWTIEMAYGSPFLLELGLSKSLMSLVWMAGPISGLIAQPFFGSMSDRCSLKMGRRRPFIIGGTLATILSMLMTGHAQDVQKHHEDSSFRTTVAISIAVLGFWIMDFAINVIMASCRALIVDVVPPSQQQAANAFASFLLGCGNITGYFTCNLNMVSLLPFMETQMKSLCYIASLILLICITCTCLAVEETSLMKTSLLDT